MFEKDVVVMIRQGMFGCCGDSPIGLESTADFVRVKVTAESQEALDKAVEILVNYRPPLEEVGGMFD